MIIELSLKGYHAYREIWKPHVQEVVDFFHETDNPYDTIAIAGTIDGIVVGHIERKFAKRLSSVMDKGLDMTGEVSDY